MCRIIFLFSCFAGLSMPMQSGVGDPQIKTDHPWYPGELACSTFERLFATQAEQYERATGRRVVSDEDKALASWFWRNTHYAHGEEGAENLWDRGFDKGDLRTREYWTGLFAHGFGLCGTTHSQWTAEMEYLLGHARSRGMGVAGHNSFEVWLTGGEYGAGRWALLDHDLSTVIYNESGTRLLSLVEVKENWRNLVRRDFKPEKQDGWLVCGLHPDDGSVYKEYNTAEYLAGYAEPPPMVNLRRGEALRRYFEPGLESGKEFVFWGRNYNTGGIPGPERNWTWVNQPEAMFGSKTGPKGTPGQARFANAVYTYVPNFKNGDYKEGVIDETESQLTFEFTSPYVIASTPPNNNSWGVYEAGCKNGLVVSGKTKCDVSVSVDAGKTWKREAFRDGLDFTDAVKGYRQYLLRFHSTAKDLASAGLKIRTVCQVNGAVLPRLKESGTTITFGASQQAVYSAGPTKAQAEAHVVAGGFNSPSVTLKIGSPRGEPISKVYAAAHIASGNPPDPNVEYKIDYSSDGGATWDFLVKDWKITRRGEEPKDFWSQSFCYGSKDLTTHNTNILVKFSNTGKRHYMRAEAHLVYKLPATDKTKVTYAWREDSRERQESKVFSANGTWHLPTGRKVRTRWVEFSVMPQVDG